MLDKVLTVDEFCAAHKLSRGQFYKMRAVGEGPSTFKLGRKTLIKESAASEWLRNISGEASATSKGARK